MIDVFFDKLNYCHKVSFEGRLDNDPYSISLADILLQKLQIWEINDKDLKDIEFLFIGAEFGDDDEQKINAVVHRQALRRRLGLLVHGDAPTSTALKDARATRSPP